MSNAFSARLPAEGYIYQVRYALFLLLETPDDDCAVQIEQLDDISLDQEGTPIELLQLKHHINRRADLTDASTDLWKTIRVWSEQISAANISPQTILTLVTTAGPQLGVLLTGSNPMRAVTIVKLLKPSKRSRKKHQRIVTAQPR